MKIEYGKKSIPHNWNEQDLLHGKRLYKSPRRARAAKHSLVKRLRHSGKIITHQLLSEHLDIEVNVEDGCFFFETISCPNCGDSVATLRQMQQWNAECSCDFFQGCISQPCESEDECRNVA